MPPSERFVFIFVTFGRINLEVTGNMPLKRVYGRIWGIKRTETNFDGIRPTILHVIAIFSQMGSLYEILVKSAIVLCSSKSHRFKGP